MTMNRSFSRFLHTLLTVTASLVAVQSVVHAEPPLEPMQPTNYGVFNGLGYGDGNDADAEQAWINLLAPEQSGDLQCVAQTHSEAVRCYGVSDYYLTIAPLGPQEQAGNANFENKDVHYRIGVSDGVGANIRTHPSAANASAIVELGLNLD